MSETTIQRLMAIFSHPDDETVIAPLLARYARKGASVHLVIATDGRLGTNPWGLPPGDELASARAEEARCACRELGIRPPILLGIHDQGVVAALDHLAAEISRLWIELQPDVVITWGPEGLYGHPDHRLVHSIVTQLMQAGGPGCPRRLYYVGFPATKAALAPPEITVHATQDDILPVRISFAAEDYEAARRALACHKTQFRPESVDFLTALLHSEGIVYLRPWAAVTPVVSEL